MGEVLPTAERGHSAKRQQLQGGDPGYDDEFGDDDDGPENFGADLAEGPVPGEEPSSVSLFPRSLEFGITLWTGYSSLH
jgi:hypothetical protein